MKKISKKELGGFIGFVAVFILSSYFSVQYSSELKEIVSLRGYWGMLAYLILEISSIVFLPLTTLPLLPVAVVLWGSFAAGVINIIGWMIGGFLAFKIARKYGKPLVSKLIKTEHIERLEKVIPPVHVFWVIVMLRISLPMDILSYTLGLFSNISVKTYMLATFVGITPFAFIFSYSVNLPVWYQVIAIGFSLGIVFFGFSRIKNKKD